MSDEILAAMWYNVRTIRDLKRSLSLIPDDTKIDIDLRLVINTTKNTKEIQYNHPTEPRNPETHQ